MTNASRKLAQCNERIAELEKERLGWLEFMESKGPGLEAYREQGQRIAKLEHERDQHAGTAQALERINIELEAKLATARERIAELDDALRDAVAWAEDCVLGKAAVRVTFEGHAPAYLAKARRILDEK